MRSWAIALACTAATASAADYGGTYRGTTKGQALTVELSTAPSGYAGTIRLGTAPLPCKAAEQGDHLAGTFVSGGTEFSFTAAKVGTGLALSTGGATYALDRVPAAAVAAPGDVKLLASTATGRSVFFSYPTATSAVDVLRSIGPTVRKLTGGTVTLAGAFAEAKAGVAGGASFTGTDGDGRPVRGLIVCGGGRDASGGDAGEAVSIVYATVDAPAADWAKLQAAMPAAALKLRTHAFPDGTGTIDLPDGWSVHEATLEAGCFVRGPDGQMISIGQAFPVDAPDDDNVKQMLQIEQQCRQMGMAVPPRPAMIVAPFSSPQQALPALFPQFDKVLRKAKGYGVRFERLVDVHAAPPQSRGGKAVQMTYTLFKVGPEGERRERAVASAESVPMPGGSWLYAGTEMSGPDARFDIDAVVMQAIIKSVHVNQAVIDAHVQERNRQLQAQLAAQSQQQQDLGKQLMDDQQKRFEAGQAAHRQQQASFDQYNQSWKDRQYAQSRSTDNFCEVIRGVRTVYDTRTNTKFDADLTSANGLARALNEEVHEPDRFVAVSLADENHPLPGP